MNVAGLIVGLGNPGRQYENTRHNMGFMTIDALLREARAVTPLSGGKFRCALWKAELPVPAVPSRTGRAGGAGRAVSGSACKPAPKSAPGTAGIPWLLAKPETFMNLSGDCVQPLAAWHRITPDRLLVVHDELDLPPGRMKFKKGGGNAGHNGLKSICERLGTPEFYRLRLGIGHPRNLLPPGTAPSGQHDVANFVLKAPRSEEQELIDRAIDRSLDALPDLVAGNAERAMMRLNTTG